MDTIRDLALFFHLVGAVVWIGGLTLTHVFATTFAKAQDVDGMRFLCGTMDRLAGPLFGSTSLVTLVAGIVLVAESDYYAFSQAFVSIGFTLFLVAMVGGAAISSRQWSAVYTVLGSDRVQWADAEPLVAKAQLVQRILLLALYVAIAVMVAKPGA